MATQPGVKIPGTDLWVRVNKRGRKEYYVINTHISIEDLREIIINIRENEQGRIIDHMTNDDLKKLQKYIVLDVAKPNVLPKEWNTVPHYPRPVEFQLSRVKHVTTEAHLRGILDCSGFRGGETGLLWWGLLIGREEFSDAAQKYLEKLFPDRSCEEKERQEPFLQRFTTSPAFQNHKSRYGNFRFSFSLSDILQKYRTQLCGEQEPIFRIYETIVYKQEVNYVVVVHSPDVHDYDKYAVLGDNDDGVCAYRDGKIIWRAQAISETHCVRLIENRDEKRVQVDRANSVFYVWDQVTLAFHLLPGKTLQCSGLLNSLSPCGNENIALNPLIGKEEAKKIIQAHYRRMCVSPGGPESLLQWSQPLNRSAYNRSSVAHRGGRPTPYPTRPQSHSMIDNYPSHDLHGGNVAKTSNFFPPRPSNPVYSSSHRGQRGHISGRFDNPQTRAQNPRGSNSQMQDRQGVDNPRQFHYPQHWLQNQWGSNPQLQDEPYNPRLNYNTQPHHQNQWDSNPNPQIQDIPGVCDPRPFYRPQSGLRDQWGFNPHLQDIPGVCDPRPFYRPQSGLWDQWGFNPHLQDIHGAHNPRLCHSTQPRYQNQGDSTPNPQIQSRHEEFRCKTP